MSAQVLALQFLAQDSGPRSGFLTVVFDRVDTCARPNPTTDEHFAVELCKHAETCFMMEARNV